MPDKILIVDDDADIRSEIMDYLEGYERIEAPDGETVLKLLRKAHEISIIILDVLMPGINGLEVLEKIKKTDPDIGIIILTGHSSKDTAIRALKARADDYIEKPVQMEKIKYSVEKLLATKTGVDDINTLDLQGKIKKVKRFIEKNCYKKTELKEAAKSVYLSPKYLSRIFKEQAGLSFTDYRLKIKIEKSKDLLLNSGNNVNQISEKLGYENAESFIRQFKRFTKHTPTEYRKMKRGTKDEGRKKIKSRLSSQRSDRPSSQ